jgi:hypothetical protein
MEIELKHFVAFVLKVSAVSFVFALADPLNGFTQLLVFVLPAIASAFLLFRQVRLLVEDVQSMPDDEGEGVEGIPDEIHLFGEAE